MATLEIRILTSEFLVEEVRLAYLAWEKSPWKDEVPKEIGAGAVGVVLKAVTLCEPRNIEPVTCPALAILRAGQQPVDEVAPGVGGSIGEELRNRLGRWG